MRNLKRALSLALASVMLLGMMVVGTSAASYPDVDGEKNVEAISVLNAVGAMIGDENGNFNPDKNVTRNEMAAVVARLLLGPDAEDYAGTVPFTDVPDWAVKYVAACYDNGIVNGVSETEYNGDGTITAEQAATMMLRALGYENITDTGADWAKRAVAKANEISLFKGVTGNVTATLTRNDVAQLSLNTLKATCVKSEVERDIVVEGVVTIPGKTTYTEVEVSLSENEWAKAIDNTAGVASGKVTVQLGEKLYEGKLEIQTPEDAGEDDLGRPANVWRYDNDDVFTVAKKADYTVTLKKALSGDDAAARLADLLKLAKKGLEATDSKTITLNGDTISDTDGLGAGDVVEMYLGSDTDSKKVDAIYVTRYVLDQITDVDDDVKDDDAEDGVSCYVDLADFGNNVNNTDIPGFNAETYVKDAYVALLISEKDDEEKIVDSYIPEIVESSIDTNKDNKEFAIGKDKYTVAAGYTKVGDGVDADAVEPGSDNTYALYLDKNGYILGIAEVEVETTSIDDVYYLDTVWAEEGKMNSKSYYAQLVALDGTKSEVELEKKDHDFGEESGLEADLSDDGYKAVEADESEGTEAKEAYEDLKGMLVTISDKKVGDSKKDNKKYNLKVWDGGDDWDTDTLPGGLELKKDSRNLGDTDYRLNKDTVYLFVEKSGQSLAVTRYVGGVKYSSEITGGCVIVEEGKTLAKYVVIATEDAEQDADYSSDLIFIEKQSTVKGKGYRSQEVYLPDGTKETWKIAEDQYTLEAPAFYAYSENDDGYYELDDAKAMSLTGADAETNKLDWQEDKPTGVLTEAAFAKSTDLFEGMLTVTVAAPEAQNDEEGDEEPAGITIKDITVDGADFKDLHDTKEDGQYDKAVKDIDALAKAMKDKKAGTATLYLNVSKDGAVSIFVTDVAAYVEPEDPESPGDGDEEPGDEDEGKLVTNATAAAGQNVTTIESATAEVTESDEGNTITVTYTFATGTTALTDGDKITLTLTTEGTVTEKGTSTGAVAGKVVTLTYGQSEDKWSPAEITVTPDGGQAADYTINVAEAEND